MESTSQLILKSHFGRLKEDINDKLRKTRDEMDEEVLNLLQNTFHYFKNLKQKDLLDKEGVSIYKELGALMKDIKEVEIEVPAKLPMAKAGNRQVKKVKKNTGS